MKRYLRSNYDFNKINKFVERALDIKHNQFSSWQTLHDIRNDENIQNLGEVMFGENYVDSSDYQEAIRRVYEAIQ